MNTWIASVIPIWHPIYPSIFYQDYYSTLARSAWKPRPVGPSFNFALLDPNCIALLTLFAVSGNPHFRATALINNLSPYPGPRE